MGSTEVVGPTVICVGGEEEEDEEAETAPVYPVTDITQVHTFFTLLTLLTLFDTCNGFLINSSPVADCSGHPPCDTTLHRAARGGENLWREGGK